MSDKWAKHSTVTGRLRRNEPNLQNIPIRTAEGRRIRDSYYKMRPFIDGDYAATEKIVAGTMAPESLFSMFGFSVTNDAEE